MMSRKYRAAIVLSVLLIFLLTGLALAAESVTGVVQETGYSGIVVKGVKYFTGRETTYTPDDYRPFKGDTVTVSYYSKATRNGEILAVSALTLVKKDPKRKDLTSPARGTIQEVGRRNIRIDFPGTGQVVSMEKKRHMETEPAGWSPATGDKVTVTFEKVKARFGNRIVLVISKLEKAK